MSINEEKEANARIFGIFSIVFSIIPILGLILGVIATQKGRNGISKFAIRAGYIGIAVSSAVFIAVFTILIMNQKDNQMIETRTGKQESTEDCINRIKEENIYYLNRGMGEMTKNVAFECPD